MVIYERAGLQRHPSSPSLCGGLARPELPVIGAVLSCIRASTYYREPLPEVRGRGGGHCCEAVSGKKKKKENEVCFTQ